MKRYLKSLTLAAAVAVAGQSISGTEAIKREFRSTWMATVWALDWPTTRAATASAATNQQNQMKTYLDQLQAQNFTSVCFQVRSMMDAMYQSSYEPWSSFLTGTRGTAPQYDPLAYIVEECHKRGLECYAWVNPYRFSTGTAWSTAQDNALRNAGQLLTYGDVTVMNPGLQATTDRIVNVCREIITNYPVDGLIFDDYFYPNGIPETSAAGDYTLWRNSGTSLSIGDWRRDNVNKMVKAVYDMVQANRPDVRFGIGPAGVACTTTAMANKYGVTTCPAPSGDWQYSKIYSEPLAWVSSRTIDFISPQIYWKRSNTNAPYGKITQWWHGIAQKFGIHHYSSMDISSNYGSDEYVADIDLERQYTQSNSPGFVFYSAKYINNDGATLGNDVYTRRLTTKTLQPEITWKGNKTRSYNAPANAKKSGNNLTWTAITDGNRIIRYSIYAVPTSVLIDAATRSDGDGIKAEYLIGISYSNTFEIPGAKRSGYWYAISVYDGFSHEHPAAYVNYPVTETAPATTLSSPANGATVEGNITFRWNAVNVDRYTLEIARDNRFSQPEYSASTTNTSTQLSASALGIGTFYWRVVTSKSGANQGVSPVWSFSIASLPTGSYEENYSITVDDTYYTPDSRGPKQINISSEWIRSVNLGNFPTTSNGALNRGFAAREDGIYVVGRVEASSNSQLYLRKYDRTTGEHITDIFLQGGQTGYFPGNDVIKDSNGNLIVNNMSLNISTTPLKMFLVTDINTGALRELPSLTYSGGGRVDHFGVYGDVTSGNYYVFAPIASSNKVIRWEVTNGVAGQGVASTVTKFFPLDQTSFGIAPNIQPINSTNFYANGANTALTRYQWVANGNANILDYFNNAPSEVRPTSSHNGGSVFPFNGSYYMVSPNETHDALNGGYKWDVLSTNSVYSYANMERTWKIPQNGLGTVNSGTYQAQTDVVPEADNSSYHIYLYAPGNGLAAYKLTTPSALTGVTVDESIDQNSIKVSGRMITTDVKADEISLYNLAGASVLTAHNTSHIVCSVKPGFYIVKAKINGNLIAKTVIIR